MREQFLTSFLAFHGANFARADFQFIEFWEAADEYASELFSALGAASKKHASAFDNRYERAKRAVEFYQDSGPCNSGFTNPTYEPVEMRTYDTRASLATNLANFASMLGDWIESYACLASFDRVAGKQIRVPERSVKDIRKLAKNKAYQDQEFAYHISPTTMDYDEALAYCYLRGSWLAQPDGDKNRFGAMSAALHENRYYWYQGDESCTATYGRYRYSYNRNCQDQFPAVCETGQYTDKCYPAAGSAGYGRCTAWGDPHYTTFDGEYHHFQGSCEYTMVEVDSVQYPNMPWFKITADLDYFKPGVYTHTRGFTFEFPGQDQSPDEIPRYVLSADGWRWEMRSAVLEDRQLGVSYTRSFYGNPDFYFYVGWDRVYIRTYFDVVAYYNARNDARFDIRIPDCYKDNVKGLCGNFNGEKYDEFSQTSLTHQMHNWRDVQQDLLDWASDFEVPDERCRQIHDFECDIHVSDAINACQPIDPENSEGLFNEYCSVDQEPFNTACVHEVCDGTDRCSSLQSYAKACLNDLAPEDRAPVCDWAAEFGCEPECGANSEFDGCADSCAATRTCENRHQDDLERCRGDSEIEGFCVCEDGYILEDGICILESDCGCNFDGSYYKLGEEFSTTDDNCECTSAGMVCTPIPCEDKEKGKCRVHSDPYIETFDGVAYDFHGTCRYALASYEDTPARAGFNIDFSNRREVQWNLTLEEWGDGSVLDQVWLEFHSSDYAFGDAKRYLLHINNLDTSDEYENTNLDVRLFDRSTGKVYYNEDVNIDDVTIDIVGQDVSITLWNGVEIFYDHVYWDMTLQVPNCFKDAIFGLCGNWDGSDASEKQIASDYKTDPDTLGENFKTQNLPFCSHGKYFAPCEALPADERNAVEQKCAALDDSNAESNVFDSCGFLDKHYYHDGCLFNGCMKRDWACGFIRSYAQQCLYRKNPDSSDFKTVCSWPEATGCEQECPAGQVFKGCTNRCLEQRTCDDVVDGISNEARCGSQRAIYPMCGCPDGQVMHEGECINEDACPRDCVSTGVSTCKVRGDPHYQTFDGEFHHFQGACKYTFAESKGDDEFRNVPAFKLDVYNERCGIWSNQTPVSCMKKWTFEFPAEGQTKDETRRYVLSVDSSRAVLEDRWTGSSYTNNKVSNDFTFSAFPVTLTTWFGARILNGYRSMLEFELPDCYKNHVDGLCGNYDGVSYDKFPQIESSFLSSNWNAYQTGLVEWANDFAEPDPRCREVIDFECDDIDEVTDMCLPLDKNIPSGVFHDCTADKDAAYVSCLIDGCGDRSSLCDSLASYAKTCLNTIPAFLRNNVCSWASETGCEKECGANSHFEGCARTCAATRTCVNRHMSDAERCGSTIDEFDSMCVCEPGYILDGGSCILEEDCGCVWDHNGVYYPQGSTFSTDEENCECTSEGVVCTPIPCENRGREYCRAHNDPYIRTFDRNLAWGTANYFYQYGFHGDCRYNLASAPDREDVPGFNVDIKNRKPWLPFVGAVTDQIWFDFHGRDYVAGDAKKYSLYVRNVDQSDEWKKARFEVTLTDNETGEKIIDAVSVIERSEYIINDDYTVSLYYTSTSYDSSDGANIYEVKVRTSNGVEVRFDNYYWSFYVYVNGCYKNEMTGLCGNYDGDTSDERLLRDEYAADGAAFGDRFQTDDDETCSHGGRLTPCEDLTTTEYNAAYSRCEAVRQPTSKYPLSYFYRNIFSGCEFLGDRTEVHEVCLFNSCVKDGLQCGIIGEYAAACLEKKTPGTADFDRICNWAASTNCEEECPADQVYKGCTNSCFEAQTCEDVARGVSKEDRCGTDNEIQGMCGCPEGQVLEDGACVDETSCGCITADGVYVRLGEEVEGSGELCTCTEEGMECVETGPCTVFIGNTPEMSVQKENMADVDISKPFKVGLQFDCSNDDFKSGAIMIISDTERPRFSSSVVDPTSPQIEDPRFGSNDKPLAAIYRHQSWTWFGIGMGDSTSVTYGDFDRHVDSSIQTWAGGFHVLYDYVSGCPGEGWTTFEFEHSFDEDTGLWTNTWTADGELIVSTTNSDAQWHAGNDFHIGLGSEEGWHGAEIEIKNFEICFGCLQTFIGPIPEISGERDNLAQIDVSKPFKTSFEMDCNNDDNTGGYYLFYITDREQIRFGGSNVGPGELEKKKKKKKRNLEDDESKLSWSDKPLAMFARYPNYLYISIGIGTSSSVTNYDFETFHGPKVQTLGFNVYSTWLTGCPADGWATFEFEHSFNEDTNLWTNTWRIDGVPVISTTNSDAEWNAGNDFWMGLGDGGGDNWGTAEIELKNFILDCSEQ